jgi:hypothetical protein
MAEFQWWLLIVGVVAGAGLVAVVFMDGARREVDIAEEERRAEATWISSWLSAEGRPIDHDDAEAVLRAHREYLALPPPDRLVPIDDVGSSGASEAVQRRQPPSSDRAAAGDGAARDGAALDGAALDGRGAVSPRTK